MNKPPSKRPARQPGVHVSYRQQFEPEIRAAKASAVKLEPELRRRGLRNDDAYQAGTIRARKVTLQIGRCCNDG
jgi:hypothetical protein